ncbi:MAG TPA: carboxypeptidase regulatory-like domain-containing protein, partial [Terriglobia bacterium]|nr:carboxypeptidase regulatory-like domain-containing protein [Terriglobia bacterium]
MPHPKRFIAMLILSLLLASAAGAQVSRGTITGIVSDPTGAVVPGVAITITNTETGVVNKLSSNESGVYTVPLLEAATYRLSAEKAGFKKYEQTGILVQVGGTARIDFALSLGEPTQSVLVTGEPSLLERETSDTQTTITSREIEGLPLTSFAEQRSPADFMQLAPGVTGRGASDAGPGNNRTMSTAVSGSMVSSTTLILDGADVTSSGGFEGDLRAFQIPPDAVGEMKMESTNAPAEFGRSAGGAASFEIKSGSNQIHGSAFEFLRNDVLDARNFFLPSVTPYRQNEFGAVAGGPIKKDKVFIFGWYDGFRWTQGVSTGESTVPTAQMLNGNFSQFLSLPQPNVLYDPTTTTTVDNVTTRSTCGPVICNNIITSPSYFSGVALKINPYFPTPNVNQG